MCRDALVALLPLVMFRPAASTTASFLVFGDWGMGNEAQHAVAGALEREAATHPYLAVLNVGDNFYCNDALLPPKYPHTCSIGGEPQSGVSSVNDSLWSAYFEEVYESSRTPHLAQLKWHTVLGNHDYMGNVSAQMAYSQVSPQWHMPAKHFQRSFTAGDLDALVLFIDTNPLVNNYFTSPENDAMAKQLKRSEGPEQLEWLNRTLAASRHTHRIVVGHHPLPGASSHMMKGEHEAVTVQDGRHELAEVLLANRVTLYLCGHVHNLQHVTIPRPDGHVMHHVISGAAASGPFEQAQVLERVPERELRYSSGWSSNQAGFVALELSSAEPEAGNLSYLDARLKRLATFPLTREVQVGVHPNPFNFSHVRLVDRSTTGNFLFRGGIPLNSSDEFAYHQLVREMRRVAGAGFPSHFQLVDICLLTAETADIENERQFFTTNPHLGRFIHWPIYGVGSVRTACASLGIPSSECAAEQPANLTAHVRGRLVAAYKDWADAGNQLDDRLSYIRSLLLSEHSTPLVLFGHCECGCDRTGEVFAAYAIRYLNQSFTQAMTFDESVPHRHIGYHNQLAAQWYCLYLQATNATGMPLNDCLNCKAFRCSAGEPIQPPLRSFHGTKPEDDATSTSTQSSVLSDSPSAARFRALLTASSPTTTASLSPPAKVQGNTLRYLDNGIVRIGIDLTRGGSIGYLASSVNPVDNVINSHDMGREVQLSFYSGPHFYNLPTAKYPQGACDKLFGGQPWAWNPIGAGDIDGNHGRILHLNASTTHAHVVTQPLQWACHDVPCDCTFEQTFSLHTPSGTGVRVDNVLHTARSDTTRYPPYPQELPAVYTNAPFHRLITYNGSRPFTSDAVVEYVPGWRTGGGFPWVPGHFRATESWAAMVNQDGWGVGIVSPSTTDFLGGFSGKKGPGGSSDPSTGYIAPTANVPIIPQGEFSFTFYLVLGDVPTIRSFAWQVQEHAHMNDV